MDIGALSTTVALNTSLPNLPKLFDNLYRAVAAILFAVWIFWSGGSHQRSRPLAALSAVVAWWDVVSTSWLTDIADWIDERSQVLVGVAVIVIVLSLVGMCVIPLGRSAPTFLLAVLLAAQTGGSLWELVGLPLAVALGALSLAAMVSAKLGDGGVAEGVKQRLERALVGVVVTLAAGIAPVMWFFSVDRIERRTGGSRHDPIHIRLDKDEGPSGSVGGGRLTA